MTIWLLVFVVLSATAAMGYFQGAIRVAISFFGLLLGLLVAMPLAGLVKPLLPLASIRNPVAISFVAPIIIVMLVLIAFKSASIFVHRKIEAYYKYKTVDTRRLLWEKLNQRLGLCLGMIHGAVYVFVLAMMIYTLGYFTVQSASAGTNPATWNILNKLTEDLRDTGLAKAVAPLSPAPDSWYDGADIVTDIFNNPLIQNRLSKYPLFLPLTDKPQFQGVAKDTAFQEFWQKQPGMAEFLGHERIYAFVTNETFLTEMTNLLGSDFRDLKAFLQTGKSEKFDKEAILGRWQFDVEPALARLRKNRPGMSVLEVKRLRLLLDNAVSRSKLTATLDKRIVLNAPSLNYLSLNPSNTPPVKKLSGTWDSMIEGSRYRLNLSEGGRKESVEAAIQSETLIFQTSDGSAFAFEREP
jgi:uncharacterized membrane protein required for colicin V production